MNKNLNIISDSRARELFDRFMAGDTTLVEEDMLYAYFDSGKVSDDLASCAPMFDWLGAGMPVPAAPRRRRRAVVWSFVASTAAMLALVLTLGAGFMSSNHAEYHDAYALYDGSYIREGGRTITDLRSILPRLQQAEARAESALSPVAATVNTEGMPPEMQAELRDMLTY